MSLPLPNTMPLLAPIYLPGQEPLPPGTTDIEKQELQTAMKMQKYMGMAMESCPLKVVLSGGAGGSGSLLAFTTTKRRDGPVIKYR